MPQVRNGHDTGVGPVSRLHPSKGEKSGESGMGVSQEDQEKTIQERMAEEEINIDSRKVTSIALKELSEGKIKIRRSQSEV